MKGVLGAFAMDLRRRVGEEKEEELPLRAWLDLAEAWRIRCALERSGGNRSAAARALGDNSWHISCSRPDGASEARERGRMAGTARAATGGSHRAFESPAQGEL